MTKKRENSNRVVALPAHLEPRSELSPATRTCRATDRLRGCEVFVKLAEGSDSFDQLRNEWQLLHRLADGYFPKPVEFRMLTSSSAYLTTAYIDGESFRTSSAIEDEAVFYAVVKQALEGLSLIHHADYVHGDIRPQNLLVAGDAKEPRAVWTDFEHATPVSSTGARAIFIEGYNDPRLAMGDAQSPRSDLYAFGRTLLERIPDEAEIRSGWGESILKLAEALCDPSPVDCIHDAERAAQYLDNTAQREGVPAMPPRPCFRPPMNIPNVEARNDWERRWPAWAASPQGVTLAVTGAAGSGKSTFIRETSAHLVFAGHNVLDLLPGSVHGGSEHVKAAAFRQFLTDSEKRPIVLLASADFGAFRRRHAKALKECPAVLIVESREAEEIADCDEHWRFPGFSPRRWYQWVIAST